MYCCKRNKDAQDTEKEMVKPEKKEDNTFKEHPDVSPVEFASYFDLEDHGPSLKNSVEFSEVFNDVSNKKSFHKSTASNKPPKEKAVDARATVEMKDYLKRDGSVYSGNMMK